MFVIIYCYLILCIRLRHWHLKLFSLLSLVFMILHVSQTCSRTGRTKVLNRRLLVLLPIPLAVHTFHCPWNAPRTFCSLFLISLLPPPSLSIIAPRYANPSISSTSSSFTTMFSLFLTNSLLSVFLFLALSLRPTLAASSLNLPFFSGKSLNDASHYVTCMTCESFCMIKESVTNLNALLTLR